MSNLFYDWTAFCKRISIKAPVQAVYDAWAIPAQLEKWFLRQAVFTTPDHGRRAPHSHIQPGDGYQWRWWGYSDAVAESGQVLAANGSDALQFTFTAGCVVSVSINSEAGETIVELWQENIPEEELAKADLHLSCSVGWSFYLTNLKSVLEGGLDLRNKNEKLANLVNS